MVSPIPVRVSQRRSNAPLGVTRLRAANSGIAQTNATVTISHSGRVIYRKKFRQAHLLLMT